MHNLFIWNISEVLVSTERNKNAAYCSWWKLQKLTDFVQFVFWKISLHAPYGAFLSTFLFQNENEFFVFRTENMIYQNEESRVGKSIILSLYQLVEFMKYSSQKMR